MGAGRADQLESLWRERETPEDAEHSDQWRCPPNWREGDLTRGILAVLERRPTERHHVECVA